MLIFAWFVSAIYNKYEDWKDFLVKRLTGARTLPRDFYKKVQDSLYNHPLKKGVEVEVVDKNCVSAMRVATVGDMFGGRLRLEYVDSEVSLTFPIAVILIYCNILTDRHRST